MTQPLSIAHAAVVMCVISATPGSADLRSQGDSSIEVLVERFKATRPFYRQLELAGKIALSRNRAALPPLESWLTHEDRHVRANVAYVYARLEDQRGLETLAAIVRDRSDRSEGQGIPGGKWTVRAQIEADRYYAVHVLGVLRDIGGVDILVPLLADPEVNYKVAWALGEIADTRATKPLIESLADPDALVRTTTIQALVKLRAKEALPHLRAMLGDHALPGAGDQIRVSEVAINAILSLEKAQ